MMTPFRKMHGLGNDFVVMDARSHPLALSTAQVIAMADRHTGIGCDQLILLHPSAHADVRLEMFNADGSVLRGCGNATRCVGGLLMTETGRDKILIETVSGDVRATRAANNQVTVDMGEARLDWQQIPLSIACDTLHLPLTLGPLQDGVGVSIGNPHCVFFVEDAAAVPLAELGPQLEYDPLFPDRANIEVIEIISRDELRMRVWERGAGLTQACGTGACASLVAAVRRGLAERKARVIQPGGGVLTIEWQPDNHVLMTGDWAESFTGEWPHHD
jgi:diaminopimelate epimerase